MDDSPATVATLRRDARARTFGGSRVHPAVTVLLVIAVVIAVVLPASGIRSGPVAISYFAAAVLFALWSFGVTATAKVSDRSIWWRYALRRGFPWQDVDAVHLGAARGPSISVVSKGLEQQITPAAGVRADHLLDFGRAVAGFAAAHHVDVQITDGFWTPLTGRTTDR